VVALEERAREGLGGLDAREGLRGADRGDACGPERVGDTGGEWGFGADDGEGWVMLVREGEDPGRIGDFARGVGAGESGDAGIVCRAETEEFWLLWAAGECSGDGVLAGAGADDEDSFGHGLRCVIRRQVYALRAARTVGSSGRRSGSKMLPVMAS
jgi:hypothetical protein